MIDNLIDARIDGIIVSARIRKDFGDINALAASIDEIGLLQPIGISADHRLVFGERRLRAFQQLGRDTIPARIVNINSLVRGEYAENEIRKDFTPSERVEIGRALEAELAGRQGQRTDLQPVENFPQVQLGSKTRDIAAQASGFGNGKTYEQAKSVVDHGVPELVEAMDNGGASVSAAAAVATLPAKEQKEAAQKGKAGVARAAKKARARKAQAHAATTPAAGTPLVQQVFNAIDRLQRFIDGEAIDVRDVADRFDTEADASIQAIADRLDATLPLMRALGDIARRRGL